MSQALSAIKGNTVLHHDYMMFPYQINKLLKLFPWKSIWILPEKLYPRWHQKHPAPVKTPTERIGLAHQPWEMPSATRGPRYYQLPAIHLQGWAFWEATNGIFPRIHHEKVQHPHMKAVFLRFYTNRKFISNMANDNPNLHLETGVVQGAHLPATAHESNKRHCATELDGIVS